MKIRAKIVFIILGMMLVSSCDNWMNLIPPQGLIREEFWKTKEDVEAVMMGAYGSFAEMNNQLFLFGELRADMVIGDYNLGSNERQVSESSIYSTNGFCNWQKFYAVINFCNEVIKNAPLVQDLDETFTDYQLNGFLSEAVFLRSLSYFYLVRIWKDVPYITEPTETDDTELYYPVTSDEEIIQNILVDLEEYRTFATTDGYQTIEEIKGRATKSAFDALLADINLWIYDYEEVLRHIAKIEQNNEIEILYPGYFFELYYPGNSLESIFEIQFNKEKNQENGLYGLTRHDNHNIDPSEKAINIFSKETGVERVRGEDISIKKEGIDNYIIWKYIGRAPDGETERASSEQTSANFIIYRLADVLLMKAEALSQLGRFTEAFNTLKIVKDRRDIPTSQIAETESAYEDAILDERARELAFEGKRWFDLMRMGRRNDYARKQKFIDIIVEDVPSAQKRIVKTKLINPLGWYLPIYEGELERNKNLEQNPYYNF